jgi:hypothetical protein
MYGVHIQTEYRLGKYSFVYSVLHSNTDCPTGNCPHLAIVMQRVKGEGSSHCYAEGEVQPGQLQDVSS